jgi:hypothetical protein
MTSDAAVLSAPRAPFAPYRPGDRNFFLVYVLLIWFGVLGGFVPEILAHMRSNAPPYPIVLHLHAAAFFGWLILLTTQAGLVRANRTDLHRRLGSYGMALGAAMVVIGPLTAFAMQRYHWGTPESDPSFIAIQLCDIVIFAGLVGAAYALRKDPSAHKRLILLATLHISNAGFARFLGGPLHAFLGEGVLPYIGAIYSANLLIVGLGAYDLATRRRLHPVYLPAVVWILSFQLLASILYHAPWWKPIAVKMIGH